MVSRDNVFFVAHLTNRTLPPLGGDETPHGLVHVKRTRFLCADRMFERVALTNYGRDEVRLRLVFDVDADFRDMFEVRGSHRPARGRSLQARQRDDGLTFGYVGLDGKACHSAIAFSREPAAARRWPPVPGLRRRLARTRRVLPGSRRRRGSAEGHARALPRGGERGAHAHAPPPAQRSRAFAARHRCSTRGWNARAPTWRC